MGHKSSRHHVVIHTPPAVQQQIIDNGAEIRRLQDEARALKEKEAQEAENAKLEQKQRFAEFIARLPEALGLDSPIPSELRGASHVVVLGDVSAGKSSLLNRLFGLSLAVGVGHTTGVAAPVFTDGVTVVWDAAGANQDFEFLRPENLALLANATQILVLFRDSLSASSHLLLTAHRLKGSAGVTCVRTQCDRFSASSLQQARSLEQEVAEDYATLGKMNISGVRIYSSAAVGANEFENAQLKQKMLGQQ